jgi:hypothetical protein
MCALLLSTSQEAMGRDGGEERDREREESVCKQRQMRGTNVNGHRRFEKGFFLHFRCDAVTVYFSFELRTGRMTIQLMKQRKKD